MRCNFCDGTGLRPIGAAPLPCPECGGCGVAHCCDGIQACCEVDGDARLETRRSDGARKAQPAAPQSETQSSRGAQ